MELGTVELLVPQDVYLQNGVHVGTKQRSGDMRPYIFKVRQDGVAIIDVRKTDEKLRVASKWIAREAPERTLVASARHHGQQPVAKFGEITGVRTSLGRFIPGTLTNPHLPTFMEPRLVMVTDPAADEQLLNEASQVGIPCIGICDTDNSTAKLDLVIPANNRGRRSLALLYWILAMQVLRERGTLALDQPFPHSIEDFETKT
ncbi:MAG: 30S ribosomal protein S2 [Candidatus Hadarchaeales archaeon]